MTSTIKRELPEIIAVDEATTAEINSVSTCNRNFVLVGPERYFFPDNYCTFGQELLDFALRPDDIFLLGHPRTGTTWTQEMIWLLNNNLDYDNARKEFSGIRFPLLDLCLSVTDKDLSNFMEQIQDEQKKSAILNMYKPAFDKLNLAPSPRFIKCHSPLSLLPSKLLDTVKVVYLIRNPRDVAVSMYHLQKIRFLKQNCDFKTFWSLFRRGLVVRSPIFPHIKEAWKMRNHPNLLILQYEEMKKDLPASLRRMAEFFGKTYTHEEIEGLCKYLDFKEFKNNPSVNHSQLHKLFGVDEENDFIRIGVVGGWRDYFKGDLEAESHNWMQENLKDTDFRFASFDPHSYFLNLQQHRENRTPKQGL